MRTWQTCADEGIALYKCCQLTAAEECLVEAVRRARNENAEKSQLAQALNNLAIVYFGRSKYHDADNILRESLSLTQNSEASAERLQNALAMHIHTQMLLEQERYDEARKKIILTLQELGDDLKFCSQEFWFSLVKTYVGLGQFAKADDAVDSFLQTTPLSLTGPYPIYIDETCGGSYFGPGWNAQSEDKLSSIESADAAREGTSFDTNSSADFARIEAEVRAVLIRVTLRTQIFSQSKGTILSVLDLCKPLGDHSLTAQTLVIASRVAFANSEWTEAANYCRQSLRIVEKIYGKHHPALLAYLINTASLTLMADGLPDCVSLMDRTFKIVAEFFGPRHPKYARCQLMWSGLMPFISADSTDINATQERLVSEALDIFLDYFDDTHSAVLSARLQLAEVLMKTDRLDETDSLLQKVFVDSSEIKNTNPYPLIGCLSEMLKLSIKFPYKDRRRINDFVYRECSKIDCEAIEGTGRQIDLMRQLAFVFEGIGDIERPEALLHRCFELSSEICPDLNHRCQQDLVEFLLVIGKPEKALVLLQQNSVDKSPQQELRDQVQIVKAKIALKNIQEAERQAIVTLSNAERMLPECPDSFMQIIGILIDLYVTSQRLDDAVRMIGILTSNKSMLGVPALDVIPLSLRMIADAFAAQGDTRAEQLYQQSIAAAEEIQGKSPETLDASVVAFADFCLSTGQIDKARKLFERWLELRSNICGEDSYACAIAMLNVAQVNIEHDLNLSLQLSSKALEIMDREKDVEPDYLEAALNLRAEILERANNQSEALAVAERAKAMERIRTLKKRKGKEDS